MKNYLATWGEKGVFN